MPSLPCVICGGETELHKIWVHRWQQQYVDGPVLPINATKGSDRAWQRECATFYGKLFFSKMNEEPKIIPAGVLAQYKCVSKDCKYVRYVSL